MAIRIPDDGEAVQPLDDSFTVALTPMRRKHLRSVLKIENEVYPHPWTSGLFMSELALRHNRSYTVAKVGGLIVGYTGMMFVGDDAHVTTIAVDPMWQAHKIASRLMLNNARIALENECRHITLEVRVSNEIAQGLYRKFGLAPAGVRKNYYAELKEDALVMWVNDIDTEEYAQRLAKIEDGIPGATIAEAGE